MVDVNFLIIYVVFSISDEIFVDFLLFIVSQFSLLFLCQCLEESVMFLFILFLFSKFKKELAQFFTVFQPINP